MNRSLCIKLSIALVLILAVVGIILVVSDSDPISSEPKSSANSSSKAQSSVSDSSVTDQSSADPSSDESSPETTTAAQTTPADNTPPVVQASDFEVFAGETVSYKKHITVSDDSDPAPDIAVDNSAVDLDKPGVYPVIYTVTDKSGNKTTAQIKLTVKNKPTAEETELDNYNNQQAQTILSQITNDSMSKMQKAYAIYRWTKYNISYVGDSDKSNYKVCARDGFKTHTGDCYTYFACAKVLLDNAGIESIDIIKLRANEQDARHFWSIINVGGGWYHFDCTPYRVGHDNFFMVTDAELKAWDAQYYPGCHNYSPEGLPELSTVSVQDKVDYSAAALQ